MKRMIACLLALCMMLGAFTGCGANKQNETVTIEPVVQDAAADAAVEEGSAPKYVFLFIGDGMSYPQIQSTSDFLGALKDEDYFMAQPSLDDNQGATLDGPEYLNFMNFEAAGSAVTYDSNSFAPDSASTATSISTGRKTYSGTINVDVTGTETFETITEKVRSQLGMKVGIISSVNLNHATPAAFYAHQASRNNYYEIGVELAASGFEYFAGGGLKKTTGYDKENPLTNLYDLAKEAGYTVTFTNEEATAVTAETGKVILIDEHLADSDAMAYELDRTEATVLHITPFNSFPSGVTARATKRYEYINWAEKRNGYIVEDNYDSELTVSSKNEDTVFSLAKNNKVIYINTFSRTVAPSIRVGYMVLPKQLAEEFEHKLGFYSCTVPVFEQYVLAELINNGDFERNINRVRRQRRKNR